MPFRNTKQNKNSWLPSLKEKFLEPTTLRTHVQRIKTKGKRIVTLNGSFDLLHAGHLHILEEAKSQGEILLVALNTDDSIKRYKGPKRPLIPLKERMSLLSALACVDYVTYFDEDDPRQLLRVIEPDVHVNGAEYGKECIEAEVVRSFGGRIHIVSLIGGLSTSQIIKKIKETCD